MTLLSNRFIKNSRKVFPGSSSFVFLIVLIPGTFNDLQGSGFTNPERIVIMTDEFDNYRRILLTNSTEKELTTQVWTDPENGEFVIRQFPIDTSHYTGRRLYRAEGNFPLRLAISFLDSHTIILSGKTTPFTKMVSYHVIEEGFYLFDIYAQLPLETYFREKTIGFNSIDSERGKNRQFFASGTALSTVSLKAIKRVDKQKLLKTRFTLAMTFSAAVVLSIIGIFLVFNISRKVYRKGNVKMKFRLDQDIKETSSEEDSDDQTGSESEEKDQTIRQIMESKAISYDEAEILLNLSREQLNVKA